MRLALRIAAGVLAALLAFGLWDAKLFSQTIWSPAGTNRLIGLALGYSLAGAMLVWRKPIWRIPEVRWFDLPVAAAVLSTAFGLAAHFAVNYRVVWIAVAIGAVAWLFRAGRLRSIAMSRAELAALILAGFPLLLHLLAAMTPESSGDGLAMHLVIPEWVAVHHRWSFDAARLAWAVMPMNGDWMASIGFLVGGELGAKFLNWIWLVVLCTGIVRVLRTQVPGEWAWAGAALFASTPLIYLITGSLFVENFWALLLFSGFVVLWEDRPLTSALLLGAAMGTKFGSSAMILVAIPFVVWKLRGKGPRMSAGWVAIFAAFACIPYVTAYAITGNPLFPFFNGVFHSPLFEDHSMVDGRFPGGVSWRLLYDAAVHSSRFMEGIEGSFGFQWLVFVPLAILLWPRLSWFARACLAAGLLFIGVEFQAMAYLRYAYPGLVLLAIPVAVAIRQDRVLAGLAAVVFALNIYFLGTSDFQHRDAYLNWFSHEEREHFVSFYTPQRRLIDELNRVAPGAPVALLAGNQIAGLQGPAYSATWHSWKFDAALRAAVAPDDVLKLLEQFGIRYVIAPADASTVQMASVQAREMLNLCTATEMEYGGFRLARVLDTCSADSRPAAGAGTYDDKDLHVLYRGAWIRDAQFAETFAHTVTYSAAAGESFRLAFNGSKIAWVFTRASNRGIAQVLIDGVEREAVDLYAAKPEWQARRSFDVAGSGSHMLEIRVTGRKNSAASGAFVDVDALIVE
ncbi:MAG: hypothetical protein ABI823_05470 [Bryobacteraceae bacterium]